MTALAAWRAAIEATIDPITGVRRSRDAPVPQPRPLWLRHTDEHGGRVPGGGTGSIADPRAAGFTGHSLRVGAAHDLLAASVDLAGLMQAGRWKSPQMPACYTERLGATQGAGGSGTPESLQPHGLIRCFQICRALASDELLEPEPPAMFSPAASVSAQRGGEQPGDWPPSRIRA